MKYILTAVFAMALNLASGQVYQLPEAEDHIPKDKEYKYLLVYKAINDGWVTGNGVMSREREWVLRTEAYYTIDELMKRLNSGGSYWNDQKAEITIEQENIIAIYDLKKAEKINLKLNVEEKSRPREVVIEADKWTERKYEIVKP